MSLVRTGSKGLEVGRVQQALIEAGYAIPKSESASFLYGPGTREAVRAFQASHLDRTGRPLTEDGVVGDETWHALEHPGLVSARGGLFVANDWHYEPIKVHNKIRRVVDLAVGEIGVHEQPDGSNDGPRVRAYTSPDFIGDPWCACFVSWCFEHGLDDGSPFGRKASTWGLFEWAEARGLVLKGNEALQPGDLFVVLRGEKKDPKRRGHVGIVCTVLDVGGFASVEGNASNAVRGLVRQRWGVSAILRPVPVQ